ncbi:MAG: iron-sulfur cluster-binding protein [Anaerolineales bacterium]|nr:MAG: iron-sulfur cluster-binding protein [Anaerolineales bacterium]
MTNFPGKGRVALIKTTPETIFDDIERLMKLAGFEQALPDTQRTGLKINISWQTWYPACSSTPWQIEGVIRALNHAGYEDLVGVHNDTVVVNTANAEVNNKHKLITEKYNVPCIYTYDLSVRWVEYRPKTPFLVLDKIFPEGLFIPEPMIGMNIIHLPTVKTHVFTTITGAMKNAFGGLLGRNRHYTHGLIHQTLVDLLQIQQDIHPGIFAVMDGTFSGDGPGPRAMRWHETDVLLASADQVAIDAVSAKLQGFDPLSLPFIRIAHEKGMGVGDPRQIEIVGEPEIAATSWGFIQEDTFASRGQKMIYHGWLHSFEKPLLRSPLVPWAYFASNFYHNVYWYPFVGRRRVQAALQTKWGKLFQSYGDGSVVMPGMEPKTVIQAGVAIGVATSILAGLLVNFLRGKKRR